MENGKIAKTTALIDSGATICCINLHFSRRMNWPLEKLQQPMNAQNTDGANNVGGMICYQIKLHLRINGKNSTQYFFILNLGKKNNIILGCPWLMKNNPHINWTTRKVHLVGTHVPQHDQPEIIEQRYLLWYLRVVKQDESEYTTWIYAQQQNAATLWQVLEENHPHIWKLTLSMALAQATEKVEQKLPPQYAKYAKVFNEPGDGELLCGLRNQISSSAHSSVVQGHVEFQGLLDGWQWAKAHRSWAPTVIKRGSSVLRSPWVTKGGLLPEGQLWVQRVSNEAPVKQLSRKGCYSLEGQSHSCRIVMETRDKRELKRRD